MLACLRQVRRRRTVFRLLGVMLSRAPRCRKHASCPRTKVGIIAVRSGRAGLSGDWFVRGGELCWSGKAVSIEESLGTA
jgi:hypothetical protein